jgi:hypothetical protein
VPTIEGHKLATRGRLAGPPQFGTVGCVRAESSSRACSPRTVHSVKYEIRYIDGSRDLVDADDYSEVGDRVIFSKTVGPHGEERRWEFPLDRIEAVEGPLTAP